MAFPTLLTPRSHRGDRRPRRDDRRGRPPPQDAPALPRLATEVAFPNLRFDRPVTLAYPDDESGLLFVVEQHTARILSFPNDEQTTDARLFLDLPQTIGRDNEEGLLGLAFHPKYRENGQFFVYYSATNPPALGRLAVPGLAGRPAAGRPEQRGGHLGVRPGPGRQPQRRPHRLRPGRLSSTSPSATAAPPTTRCCRSGQDPTDFFASILRVDVDHPAGGKAYGIPADNPRPSRPEVRPLGPRGLRHRPPERLEVLLRPRDRRPLGRRRRPEQVGGGRPDRQRRQLRLERLRSVPPVPDPRQPRRAVLAAAAAGRRVPAPRGPASPSAGAATTSARA